LSKKQKGQRKIIKEYNEHYTALGSYNAGKITIQYRKIPIPKGQKSCDETR